MRGRFFIALLAILLMVLAEPHAARAQSYRAMQTREGSEMIAPLRRLPPALPFILGPSPIALSQMSHSAGLIFSGRVIAIARIPTSARQTIQTVAVTFHVERAIRGVKNGQTLRVLQWAGLWSQGQHYRIGERLLVFLYRPSHLGLTSSVGGPLGRFSVNSAGQILLSEQHLSAFAADPVLGGKSRVTFSDFVQNVRRASGENERLR